MADNFADRLVDAMRQKNAPVCVGLDPVWDRLPNAYRPANDTDPIDPTRAAAAIHAFCTDVIDVVAPHVPAVKINIAFFERYHAPGVNAYYRTVHHAQTAGLIVIGDVKRADIGHSTAQYAHAQLAVIDRPGHTAPRSAAHPESPSGHITGANAAGGDTPAPHANTTISTDGGAMSHANNSACPGDAATPDAVTVNPYFGYDGISPFIDIAKRHGRGIFVLVQTSNHSAAEVQGLELAAGGTVAEHVAELVHDWATRDGLVGQSGYSAVGAVVAPQTTASTERIRALMPRCLFLVPGFGAQGRTTEQVARCFQPNRTGAIVNASRSVIYAFERDPSPRAQNRWHQSIDDACQAFVHAVRDATDTR